MALVDADDMIDNFDERIGAIYKEVEEEEAAAAELEAAENKQA